MNKPVKNTRSSLQEIKTNLQETGPNRIELPLTGRGRSKLVKLIRMTAFEHILCDAILDGVHLPGSVRLGELLGVIPRTARTYLKERRERMCGPQKIWLHSYEDAELTKPVGRPELITIHEYAKRIGITVREARRQIWKDRSEKIAKLRKECKAKTGS
jgi:hypothetical protein